MDASESVACTLCGDTNDLLTPFTKNHVCQACTKKQQQKATKPISLVSRRPKDK